MPDPTGPQSLLTGPQAAEILQVSDETIRRWAEDGRLRHIVLPSGHRRYLRADLDAILTPVEPTEAAS